MLCSDLVCNHILSHFNIHTYVHIHKSYIHPSINTQEANKENQFHVHMFRFGQNAQLKNKYMQINVLAEFLCTQKYTSFLPRLLLK